ncbi:dihydrofolate reductase family protein [Mycobacterium sp. 236(2023)]|uniref:dihydrofolate reductase family protein n=1 Tax=Mycobacterium sp. 236(2023) TaxID=3038163 RepID=UPI002414D4C5|nr:dihydrofolate reductase family protein [Mycobacterium sp. 236(2023)]MDG4666065.1 dihydrofolate reductase family protein [Mycobacterium sp. 236(2023)]
MRGNVVAVVQRLKEESGDGLFVGGVQLPMALAEAGLTDEYEFVVHPRIAGHGPALFAAVEACGADAYRPAEFSSGAVALRYAPAR